MELRLISSKDWLWIPSLFLLSYLAFSFYYYRNHIKKYSLALLSNREFNDLVRDESKTSRKASLTLNIFFLLSYSQFIFVLVSKLYDSSIRTYLITQLVVLILIGLKYISIYFLGILFQTKSSTQLFLNSMFASNKVFGLFLFPLFLVSTYSIKYGGYFFITSLVIWCVFNLFKWYSGIKLGLSVSGIPKIYPFLYICTLEILPIAILAKMFWEQYRVFFSELIE